MSGQAQKYIGNIFLSAHFLPTYLSDNSYVLPSHPQNINEQYWTRTSWTTLKEQLRLSNQAASLVLHHYKALSAMSAEQNYLFSLNKNKHCIYTLKPLKKPKWELRSSRRSACALGCPIRGMCLGSNLKGILSILEDLPWFSKKSLWCYQHQLLKNPTLYALN